MNVLTLYHTIPTFNDPVRDAFENIMGKGENAGNQPLFNYRLENALNLDKSKILSSGKELSAFHNFCYLYDQYRSRSGFTKLTS